MLKIENLLVQLLKKNERKEMLWKNGLGTTYEIDLQPIGATFPNEFDWRLSSAIITSSNTFSNFLDYDRILVIISGSGLKLNNNFILRPLTPYKFSGEEIINCEMIDEGQIIDVGLIYKRGKFMADLKILSNELNCSSFLEFDNGWHYLVIISGELRIQQMSVSEGDTIILINEFKNAVKLELSSKVILLQFTLQIL